MPLRKESLERLIEASPEMVIATDSRGRIAYYNNGARDNLGYTREEIIGEHVTRLYPDLAEAKRVMNAMRDPARDSKGRTENFPTRFVTKEGDEIPVAISGTILYDEDGSEEGTIGFATNLSEIIRKDKLAVLGEIAIGLSHEINNPLAVIVNQLDLVESTIDPGDAATRARLESIRGECGRIEALLERLNRMAEREEYASTPYLGDARMIDLSECGPLEGLRALVVDDDPGVRETASDILRSRGAEVSVASNGQEALASLERRPYDVVLSDVVMPGMDGYELFRAARARHPDTQVVLMTAFYYDKDHVIKRSRMEGLDGVLFKKPIDPDRLCRTIAKLVKLPRPDPS